MTPDEFTQQSARTAIVNQFHGDEIDREGLLQLLYRFISTADVIDAVKKKIFYGKEIPEVYAAYKRDPGSYYQRPVEFYDDGQELLHAFLGVITEAGEMAEVLVKAIETGKNFDDVDKVNVIEEIGDINWYQAQIFRKLGITFEDTWIRNIQKLKARYPEGPSGAAAIDRNLRSEREALEQTEGQPS